MSHLARLWLDRLRLWGIAIGLIVGMWISFSVLGIGGLALFLVTVLGYSVFYWVRRGARIEFLTDDRGYRPKRNWLVGLFVLIPLGIIVSVVVIASISSIIGDIIHGNLSGAW